MSPAGRYHRAVHVVARLAILLLAAVLTALLVLLPNPLLLRAAVLGAVLAGAVVGMRDGRRGGQVLGGAAVATLLLWALLQPRLDRTWDPTQATMPRAASDADGVTFTDVRAFRWTEDDHTPGTTTVRCDFDDLRGLDFIVSKFAGNEAVAHTLVSLHCGGPPLVVSPEIRREDGESYSVVRGLLRHYELMYVLSDERDALHLRTHVRGERVTIFPAKVTSEQLVALLRRFAERVEQLATAPDFYNTATASCATTLAADVQHIADGALDLDWRVLLPGFSGEMAHELGLLQGSDLPFAELATRHAARADAPADPAVYSRAVRGLPYGSPAP